MAQEVDAGAPNEHSRARMTIESSSNDGGQADKQEEIDPVLGRCLHVYQASTKTKEKDKTRRQLEIVGVLAVLMIPISLMFVKGTAGTGLAVFGGVVALLAYYLSARKPLVRSTTIKVHEQGVVCTEAETSRQVHWNEVVDVKTKRFALPDGRATVAIALEVVAAPPLLVVVSGTFTEKDRAGKLVEALSSVWLPVWCRRTRAMLEAGLDVEVGLARMSGDCLSVGDHALPWPDVQGVSASAGIDELRTTDGSTPVECSGMVVPFPSTARRLAALAAVPPSRPLLPPPRK